MGIAKIKQRDASLLEEEIILHLLKEFSQVERNMFRFYFYEKLSTSTISELINIPGKGVKSHLSNVMDKRGI